MRSSRAPESGSGREVGALADSRRLRESAYNILRDFPRAAWESFAIHDEEVN
jgi:hypothetical protein